MKKTLQRCLCLALSACLLAGACLAAIPTGDQLAPEQATPSAALSGISAPSAILMEEGGQVLYEKDADTPREPASVTKIMTMLLVMEALDSGKLALTDMVTASAHATSMGGSQVYLKEHEQMTVEDMLKSVAMASANDCAVALAEHLAGTEEAFVALMNERAAQLGMENTHFVNCNGLPAEGHVTTARDTALMSRELLKHDQIFAYTTLWMDSVRDGAFGLTNTNRLIRTYQGMNGLKTGYTTAAGYCLSATAERDGLSLIAVVMGAASADARNADVTAMLNYGFANYQAVTITTDRPIMPVPVQLGVQGSVLCQLQSQGPLVMEKSKVGALEKDLVMAEKLQAPVQQGQQVGTLHLTANGEEVAAVPIVAAEAVEKQGVLSLFCQLLRTCCMRQAQG